METGIACYTRGAFLPSVTSQHSNGLVSPPSISPSFSSRVWKIWVLILHICMNSCKPFYVILCFEWDIAARLNWQRYSTILVNIYCSKSVKGCVICMTEFEIELTIWGIIEGGTKIISKSFEGKELFTCNKMWNWWQLGEYMETS